MIRPTLFNVIFIVILSSFVFSCIKDHEIPSDNSEKTKLLLRNWTMLNIEKGRDSLENGKYQSAMLISADGTLRTRFTENGQVFTSFKSWKWHPTQQNWMSIGNADKTVFNPENYWIIRGVTEDTLKISLPTIYGLYDFSFVPEL